MLPTLRRLIGIKPDAVGDFGSRLLSLCYRKLGDVDKENPVEVYARLPIRHSAKKSQGTSLIYNVHCRGVILNYVRHVHAGI